MVVRMLLGPGINAVRQEANLPEIKHYQLTLPSSINITSFIEQTYWDSLKTRPGPLIGKNINQKNKM